jgi:hypothetical protein
MEVVARQPWSLGSVEIGQPDGAYSRRQAWSSEDRKEKRVKGMILTGPNAQTHTHTHTHRRQLGISIHKGKGIVSTRLQVKV